MCLVLRLSQRCKLFEVLYGQVTKRTRRMPWQSEAMKDVVACDKIGRASCREREKIPVVGGSVNKKRLRNTDDQVVYDASVLWRLIEPSRKHHDLSCSR